MLAKSLAALLGSAAAVQAYSSLNGTAHTNSTAHPVQEQQGFEVVVVYAPATHCPVQPTECSNPFEKETHHPHPPPKASHSVAEGIEGHKTGSKETVTLDNDAPAVTLSPAIHWTYDTKPAANVIPIPAKKGSQLYYGVDNPSKGGHYAFMTYYFESPSVNLDHCDHVSSVKYGSDGLTINFNSEEAYKHAYDSWKGDEDLILVTYTEGCGDYAKGERCYFKVSDIKYKKGELCIIADGKPCHPDDVVAGGDTEWGYWEPRHGGVNHPGSYGTLPGQNGGSGSPTTSGKGYPTGTGAGSNTQTGDFTWNPTATAPPSATTSAGSDDSGSTNFAASRQLCKAPEDTKYGLPSACLGEFFDLDLDNDLGYDALSQEYLTFAKELAPGIGVEGEDSPSRRLKRGIVGDFLGWVKDTGVKIYEGGKQLLSDATTISGSFNREISWRLPDPAKKESKANQLKDPNTKQVTSPWGDSILLKAFGNQEPDEEKKVNGYMNVFCVGCGVSGSARVAGKASWSVPNGFTTGEVTINTDVQFVLKIGIDAQLTYEQDWNNMLLEYPIPVLEYGIVRIGPAITVDSHVKLEAAAKGKLLAGAEMGLQNAQATVDFINPSKSSKQNWDPYFKPIFEAEGELMVGASLGLPLGIRCGVRVSKWNVDLALIDEPSIKGVAQVAASIGLEDGKFQAGFKDIDGCTGISTQVTWRNQLFVDVVGLTQIPLFDTEDRPLARGCIPLPGRPSGTTASIEATTSGTVDPTNTADATATSEPIETEGSEPTETEGSEPTETEDSEPTEIEGSEVTETEDSEATEIEGSEVTETDEPGNDQSGGDQSGDNDQTDENTPARRLRVRQSSSNNSTGNVVDLTSKVENGTSTLSYDIKSFANKPYNLTNGFELVLMVDDQVKNMVVSCANGNVYAFKIDGDDNPNCSEMWAGKEDVTVFDGAERIMHYYNNSMAATGVSRLRLEDETDIPSGGVVIAFAPYFPKADSDDYFYVAVDPKDNVFYPIVCEYADGKGSRMFLAKDPEEGATMLKSPDLEFTVTGGKVSDCFPMVLQLGEYVEGDDWESLGETGDDEWEWEFEDE